MLKLSDNPPIRPARFASVRHMPGEWFVAHAKPRCEKAFAWDMGSLGIAYFLPLVTRLTFSGGRKRTVLKPLFSGYLFVNGSPDDRLAALRTDRLVAVHPVKQRESFVDQIAAIEVSLEAGLEIDLYPFAVVGRRVRVTQGPLEGVTGTIVDRDNVSQLVIEVNMLGQNVAVRMHADLVEALEA